MGLKPRALLRESAKSTATGIRHTADTPMFAIPYTHDRLMPQRPNLSKHYKTVIPDEKATYYVYRMDGCREQALVRRNILAEEASRTVRGIKNANRLHT